MGILIAVGACAVSTACSHRVYEPAYGVCSDLKEYRAIAGAGYDYIECGVGAFLAPDKGDSDFRANLEEKERLGAKILACNGFLPGNYTVVGPRARHDDIVVWAETAFSRARMAGIPYIVFGSGGARRIPEGFEREAATGQFVELCKRLGPIAAKYGVTVVIEPLNSGETNFINSVEEGAAIVRTVDHPNIRLLCDIFHMAREGEPASNIVKYGKYIKHCHIAEEAGRTAPGTDGYDFTPYFDAMKEIRYNGGLSVECLWGDFRSQLAPALKYMKERYVNKE